MTANGLAVPILVRPAGDRFVIVHGERRWRAAVSLGWPTIPAEVRDLTPEQARWLALVENLQRADLTPIEEAEAYQAALVGGMTQAALGAKLGKSQSAIAQKLRLLKLPDPLAFYLRRGYLTEGHVRQLLRLKGLFTEDVMRDMAREAVDPGMAPGLFSDRVYVMGLFIATRPEDKPVSWFGSVVGKQDEPGKARALADACETFIRWAVDNDYRVPNWAISAFWWGGVAVLHDLSVANLQSALDLWEERFLSAVLFTQGVVVIDPALSPTAREKERERQRWGYRSDLRHAGVAQWFDESPPESVITRAYEMAVERGSVAGPSGLCHVT